MNKKLLFVAALCTTMLFGGKANAAYVDKTAAVSVEATAWGTGGSAATQFAPAITTADGRTAQLPEHFQSGACDKTGVLLKQSLTGLENGTYTVVLYANAFSTHVRDGFSSDVTDGALDVAYVYAGDKQVPVKAQIATSTTANGEYTIEDVVVTDGTLEIGLAKAKAGTNWHTIQIKSLSLWSEDSELDIAKNALMEKINEAKAIDNASQALTDAITAAQNVYDTATEPAEANDAAQTLQTAIATEKNYQSVADATAENPIKTDFVVNGTFDNSTAPWKTTTGAQNKGLANNQQGAFTGNFFENWNPSNYTGKIYQEIANIPNGTYQLSISAFASNFKGENQFVYANADKTHLTQGAPTAYTVYTIVTEGKIEIGMEQDAAVNNWIGIDNISLTYYGADVTIADAKKAGTKKQINDLLADEYVSPAAKEALTEALTGLEAAADDEAINAAIAAAEEAIATAAATQSNGKAIAALKTFLASTNVYTKEAYEAFSAKIAEYEAAFKEGTLTEKVPNPDVQTGWKEANIFDDLLLSTWGVKDYDSDLYINCWSTEGNNDGTEFRTPFFEYWTGDENALTAKTHTATLTGLQPGQLYDISALVRIQARKDVSEAPQGIAFQVGEGEAIDVTTGEYVETAKVNLGTFTARGMSDEDGTLTAKFIIAEGNNVHWLSWKNLQYSLVPEPGATVSELTENGVYAILHPESDKFLANNDAGDKAALQALGNIEDMDAYKWNIDIRKGADGQKDTLTIQQVSSQKYFGAVATSEWSMELNSTADAKNSSFLLTPDGETYTLSSLKNTGKMVGFDNTNNGSTPYFNKGTGNHPYLQFMKAADFDTYISGKLYRNAKAELLATIQKIKSLQDGVLDGIHTAEEEAAFADTLTIAKEMYKLTEEELPYEALLAKIEAYKEAITAYQQATEADTEHPADFTFHVTNPDMEANTGGRVNEGGVTPGWEGTVGITDNQHNQHGTKYGLDTEFLQGKAIEIWRASAGSVDNRSIFQTIENLPNGKYTVAAAIFAADQNKAANDNVGTMEWFANEQATEVEIYDYESFTETPDQQSEAGVFGAAKIYAAEVTVTDGILKFGVRDNSSHCNWFGFDNVTLTYFGEPAAPAGKKEEIAYEVNDREAGLGYAETTLDLDTTAIKEKLGIELISDATLYIVNADESLVANTTDGWRDAEGNAINWGENSIFCLKCFPEDNQLWICTYPGRDLGGDVFVGRWAFVAGIDTVIVKTTITLPVPEISRPDQCENMGSYDLKVYARQDKNYKPEKATLDVADVAAKLGTTVEELGNAKLYALNAEGNFVTGSANNGGAWFDAEGISSAWGENAKFFLEPATMGDYSVFNIGQMPEQCEIAKIYTATAYIVLDAKMVTLNIALRIADPNGIDETLSDEEIVSTEYFTIDGAQIDAPAQGKYIERVTYSNGTVKSHIVIK